MSKIDEPREPPKGEKMKKTNQEILSGYGVKASVLHDHLKIMRDCTGFELVADKNGKLLYVSWGKTK